MNKQDLLLLEKLSTNTPKELAKSNVTVFNQLNEKAVRNLKIVVEEKLKDAPREIRESLQKIDFSPGKLDKADLKVALLKHLLEGHVSGDRKVEIEAAANKLPNLGKLDDVLMPDIPVSINPIFQPELMKARVFRLSDIAGISEAKVNKSQIDDLNAISAEKLESLTQDKVLTGKEAKALGQASNLYQLLDYSFELTAHVQHQMKVDTLEDLVNVSRQEWLTWVKDSKVELPKGMKQPDYADLLYKKVENLFPEPALLRGIGPVKAEDISGTLNALKGVFKNNSQVFGTSFDDLNLEGISAAEQKKLKPLYEEVEKVSRRHPGLGLAAILNDNAVSAADRGKRVAERVDLMEKFKKNNADINFLSLDYKHDSADIQLLNFTGFKPEEKTMVLGTVKSYQRVYNITNDIEHTERILEAGFHSAFQVVSVTLTDFITATKLDTAVATKYFENAHMSLVKSTGVMGSILDILTCSFDWLAIGNLGPGVKDYLRKIPGYQDLFGDLAFCDCEHCQSIYSPGAYFVDLMQFIDRYVVSKHFTGAKATHVLNLKVRRPDLWTLPLTCENTSTLIPYLDIINEILESYNAKKKGYAGDLNDRVAVEDFVYKKEIALEKPGAWKNGVHAFTQPYHHPQEAVATYLRHFEKTREQIGLLLNKPDAEVSKATLGLSEKEYTLVTVPDSTEAFIKRVYGITFTLTAGKITPFDAQRLLKPVGVDRKELGRLVETAFVSNNGADNILIKGEKINSDSIQNDIERVRNLTYDALDRLHRFVRLWRKTSWTIEELDLVLKHLQAAGISTGIVPEAVTAIGKFLRLKEALKMPVEEVCGITHLIPVTAVKEDEKSFFDALFNHEDVVLAEGSYPKNAVKLIHPALAIDQSTVGAEFSSSRLMMALGRADDEVLALIQNLAQPLGIVGLDSAVEGERGFNLTLANLSLLYRHSRLAEFLKLSVTELFRLLKLTPDIPNAYIENQAHVEALLKFFSWWKGTKFSFDELNYILAQDDVEFPETFKSAEDIAAVILPLVSSDRALLFADTVFTTIEAITEEQSRAILQANPAAFEATAEAGVLRLTAGYDPAVALTIPAGITVPEPELRAVLTQHHPAAILPHYLSAQVKFNEGTISRWIARLGIDLNDDVYLTELQAGDAALATNVVSLIDQLLPLEVLFKDKKWIAEAVDFVIDNGALLGIADWTAVALADIQALLALVKFVSITEEETNNVADLAAVLTAYVPATKFQTSDPATLALMLGTKKELVSGIHAVAVAKPNAVQALVHYQALVDMISFIGIGADVLPKIVSIQYDELNQAVQAIVAAFRSKYPSESERKEKLEKFEDMLRGKKRASLTTYLIHSGFPQFENENDLFHYFLVDTELEGCARTSRLVAATMSLQLYIHRILLNLEQDAQEPGTPGRVHVQADDIPGDEWSWRKNYRVWEANRKVFLYPENYIEPELRDDKTPLFEDLESELLQREINADNVLDAYSRYMRGFDEVAHLKIAGSYHEKDAGTATDVLHLFGVTADEPPMYYYRRVENIYYAEKRDDRGVVWEPWRKIGVQIPVRKVAPITFNGRLHVFWVKVTTLANTVFDNNRSIFTGYSHKMSIEFTTLKLDGTWTTPQKLNLKDCYPFKGNGVIQDPLVEQEELAEFVGSLQDLLRSFPFFDLSSLTEVMIRLKTPRYDITEHYEPIDEYTLDGFMWNQVFPYVDSSGHLILTGAGYQMRAAIDFYNLEVQNSAGRTSNVTGFEDPVMEALHLTKSKPGKIISRSNDTLFRTTSPSSQWFDNYAYGSLILNMTKPNILLQRHWNSSTLDASFNNIYTVGIAQMPGGSSTQVVNGAYSDAIVDANGDWLLIQGTPVAGDGFVMKRLGTTLSETLTRTLFTSGVDTTLNIATQKALKEAVAPVSIVANRIVNEVVSGKIDFKGAYGNYFREIFFHIPFLLANHLNSQGKYADAQKWYHYIFNPTATEVITFPPGATAAEKKKLERDRNWQYLEFREIDAQKLRDQLNDKAAIEVYKKDPFNPHAIARLRMSAYQKAIVMKYVDNLLDWADQLFSQDSMESINEATMLYIIAKEILGKRPAELGDCGEGQVNPKTYEKILPLLNNGSEFLAELESYTFVRTPSRPIRKKLNVAILENQQIKDVSEMTVASSKYATNYSYRTMGLRSNDYNNLVALKEKQLPEITIKPVDDKVTGVFAKGTTRGFGWLKDSAYVTNKFRLPSFGWSILKHVSPVFCVPGNKDLLDYYNRVDDRLYKIRHCMNIQGQRRQLALFQPEIDPRLLVRAKAAGLSLEDVLSALSGNVPPYRFVYILDKAKAFVSVVQNFGSSLLGAIEKKSNEELSLLRLTQQQNILELSTKSRRLEIDSASEGIDALNLRIESLTYQIGYYDTLIAERTTGWETAQQVGIHGASIIRGTEATIAFAAGMLALIPQVGSPFAMKYGGVELNGSMGRIAFAMSSLANLGDNIAKSAGLEASFDRRSEGWRHQRKQLDYELQQAQKNLVATTLRRDMLVEALSLHEKNMEHNQDVMDFYGEKFSNLGLYTWLSTTMQRLFREAFNNALAIAKLAEQSYRYERDDTTFFIQGSYFDSSKGGLLAGESLLMALQSMERRYLETNYRKNEIDQAFSLTQINPAALLSLKQTGECTFDIPEIYFDLFYPGQYRRKIQAVRLTIPSVTGPYTNVSATLSLMGSKIRLEAATGSDGLMDVPRSRTTTIATSTAQNDAGVFQLNFKDERYMPFEGAGAVSAWKLSLPKNFRQFDYNTINDIIIHISYTAEYDELFRDNIEQVNGEIETILMANTAPLRRVISLRQEFSTDFHRLVNQAVNSPVVVKIQNKHFPLFMNGKDIKVTKADLILVTPKEQTASGFSISVNTVAQNGFTKSAAYGNLYSKSLGSLFNAGVVKEHTVSILNAGDLAMEDADPGDEAAIDVEKLEDVLIYLEYKVG